MFFISNFAFATKPCPPFDPGTADLVFVGRLISRTEWMEPYSNCYMKDKSKCQMEDKSTLTVNIEKILKGTVSLNKTMKLTKGACALNLPTKIGKNYRFFLQTPGTILSWENI